MLRAKDHNVGIDRLVERQMRNWELAKSQPLTSGHPESEMNDFITVSQAVGSGGGAIAQQLADRLGWPLFDKDLLLAMARDDAVRARIYASMDERDLTGSSGRAGLWRTPNSAGPITSIA